MNNFFPNIRIEDDYDAMSQAAANAVIALVKKTPAAMICMATGASPLGVYERIAARKEDLGRVRILKLDEWGGLAPDDPATCETYIKRHILEPWGVAPDRYLGFKSDAPNAGAECARIEELIAAEGGIDLCILGMGADGHIGLNYPADSLPPLAHPTSAATLRHAMLDAAQGTPTHGLTLGMGDVLRARHIVLVVNGASKADAVSRLIKGEITPQFPASLLWLHPRVTCIVDRAAAAKSSNCGGC